ncbi:hypothetical protein C8R44DRAFT_869393 [Mycena epipterygia]|nr:hypothetical protein C8R44DRAFT_869393 [Mycena epipterygia]
MLSSSVEGLRESLTTKSVTSLAACTTLNLAMLPCLVDLRFTLRSKWDVYADWDPPVIALLEEARLAMPWVPHISHV